MGLWCPVIFMLAFGSRTTTCDFRYSGRSVNGPDGPILYLDYLIVLGIAVVGSV
jgi:hypothetical protein